MSEQLELPDWIPQTAAERIRKIEGTELPATHIAILGRLATDPRMRSVWAELIRKDKKTGAYRYRVIQPNHVPPISVEEEQANALGEVLSFAFDCAT